MDLKNNELMVPIAFEADSDEHVAHFKLNNFEGHGRLVLDTKHGQIIIDDRLDDVNCFVVGTEGRTDHLLIKGE